MKGDCRRLFNPSTQSKDAKEMQCKDPDACQDARMPGCQDVKVEDIQTESHQNEGEIVPGTFVFSQRVHGDLSMSIAPGSILSTFVILRSN